MLGRIHGSCNSHDACCSGEHQCSPGHRRAVLSDCLEMPSLTWTVTCLGRRRQQGAAAHGAGRVVGEPLVDAGLVELVLAGRQPPQHLIPLILPKTHAAGVAPACSALPRLTSPALSSLLVHEEFTGVVCTLSYAIKGLSSICGELCDLICDPLSRGQIRQLCSPVGLASLHIRRSRHLVRIHWEAADDSRVNPQSLRLRSCNLHSLHSANLEWPGFETSHLSVAV